MSGSAAAPVFPFYHKYRVPSRIPTSDDVRSPGTPISNRWISEIGFPVRYYVNIHVRYISVTQPYQNPSPLGRRYTFVRRFQLVISQDTTVTLYKNR